MVFFFYLGRLSGKSEGSEKRRKSMIIFLGLVIGLIVLQNGTAVGLAKFFAPRSVGRHVPARFR